MSSCTVEEILGRQVFYRWHARFGTCYIKPLMKIIRRAKKSLSSLLNSRPRKKTIESELLASSLVGDGREEQCTSSEAPVTLPQSRPGHQVEAWRRSSRSERDGETDMHAWLCREEAVKSLYWPELAVPSSTRWNYFEFDYIFYKNKYLFPPFWNIVHHGF
jgi:hypothetical protein